MRIVDVTTKKSVSQCKTLKKINNKASNHVEIVQQIR